MVLSVEKVIRLGQVMWSFLVTFAGKIKEDFTGDY
jgi:hypothetical protein